MEPATVARLVVVLVTVLCGANCVAQQSTKCDYVVQQVSFENTTGLTAEQSAELEKTVLGRCFPRNAPSVLSEAVYRQLRKWGFTRATVEDPDHGHSVRVLDGAIHPSPVAVVIDFRLYEDSGEMDK